MIFGIKTPGVLGPITITSFFLASSRVSSVSRTGTCSGIATRSFIPAYSASFAAPRKNLAGTNIIDILEPVASTASFTVL